MKFYERLQILAKEKNKSFNQIENDLNLSKNTLYNYKTKKPTADNITKLANYFNVSTDYLLGNINFKASFLQTKNTILEEKLGIAVEALTRIKLNGLFKKAGPHGDYAPYDVTTQTEIAEKALAEIEGEKS